MLKPFLSIFSVFGLILLLSACKEEQSNLPDQTLYRFDELFSSQKEITTDDLAEWETTQPAFYSVFLKNILRAPEGKEVIEMNKFKSYFDSINVSTFIQDEFSTHQELEKKIGKMQQRLVKRIPNYQPYSSIITMNSGFNYKNFLLEDAVAIGLDMYLGNKINYTQLGENFPSYKAHTFHKDYLTSDLAEAILTDLYPDSPEQASFLDKILYKGKLLAFKEAILPEAEPHTLIGMTKEEFEWCKKNERNIYRYFTSEELLYNRNFARYKTYINEGPTSSGMPTGAPANTGSYIGWRILSSYLKSSKEEIQNVMNTSSQEIIKGARYAP